MPLNAIYAFQVHVYIENACIQTYVFLRILSYVSFPNTTMGSRQTNYVQRIYI